MIGSVLFLSGQHFSFAKYYRIDDVNKTPVVTFTILLNWKYLLSELKKKWVREIKCAIYLFFILLFVKIRNPFSVCVLIQKRIFFFSKTLKRYMVRVSANYTKTDVNLCYETNAFMVFNYKRWLGIVSCW